MHDPVHLSRLAQAEAAGALLLLQARRDAAASEAELPDAVCVEVSDDGLAITYLRHGVPIAGEGL